jgi:DNA invertase Pin-like site-specific DNA recombinase
MTRTELSTTKKMRIRRLRKNGYSFREIARIVGCSKSTAHSVCNLSIVKEPLVKVRSKRHALSKSDVQYLKLLSLRDRR